MGLWVEENEGKGSVGKGGGWRGKGRERCGGWEGEDRIEGRATMELRGRGLWVRGGLREGPQRGHRGNRRPSLSDSFSSSNRLAC